MVKAAGLKIVPIGRINLDAPNVTLSGITIPPKVNPQTCNCVAFRLENIQDYSLVPAVNAIAQIFQSNGVPLTLDLWGGNFGLDPTLLPTLQDAATNKTWGAEIACYGYDGEDYLTLATALQAGTIANSTHLINAILGVTPTTFVPPYGDFTIPDTLNAVLADGYKVFSALTRSDVPPYNLNNPTLWHFPAGAQTSDPANTVQSVGITANATYQLLQTQLQDYGFAVVSIGPQEFSAYVNGEYADTPLNTTMLTQLQVLINLVKAAGLRIVTVGSIPSYLTNVVTAPVTTGVAQTIVSSTQGSSAGTVGSSVSGPTVHSIKTSTASQITQSILFIFVLVTMLF